MRGVKWRTRYKIPIIWFITKSNKSAQHQFITTISKEVAPGIKFQGLILMSSRLIDFTSDLHGSLKIYWEQMTYAIIQLISLFATNLQMKPLSFFHPCTPYCSFFYFLAIFLVFFLFHACA